MTADELDDLILAHLAGTLDAAGNRRLDEALVRDPAAGRRLAELALNERILVEMAETDQLAAPRRARPRVQPAPRSSWTIPLAIAAAAGFALLLLFAGPGKQPPPRQDSVRVVTPLPPPELPRTPEVPTRELPPRVPEKPEQVKPSELPPPPKPEAPRPEPPPSVIVELPKKDPTAPILKPAPALVPVTLAEFAGPVVRIRDGRNEPAAAGMSILAGDQLAVSSRRAARFRTDVGLSGMLQAGTALTIEHREDGRSRALITRGTGYFEIARHPAPLTIATPHAEALVLGTSLMLEVEEKRTILLVMEGSVSFRTGKGDVEVRPGQRSSARAGEKPAAPAKADVVNPIAWTRRPELAPNPERTPFLEHELGANRRLPGLAIAAPFYEGEPNSGRLARALAERLDVGLALGHHYRDIPKKVWFNIDRGLQADVRDDGSLGQTYATEISRSISAEYLGHVRAAAGVAPREPAPMVVQLRDHNLRQDADELDVCEVAFSGWNRAAIAGLKPLYSQLLEKHKPSWRLELRFQGPDDTYEFKGRKRAFFFTEEDARSEGYMAPRQARNAAVFFLPPTFEKHQDLVEVYSKILAELVEYLHARKR